jgi:hypothetical protein
MSRHQDAGQNRNIKETNKFPESAGNFQTYRNDGNKYMSKYIQEEIKSKLKLAAIFIGDSNIVSY